MERIIILVLIELSLKHTIHGLPLELVDLTTDIDDIVQPKKDRIIFAGVPLVPTDQTKVTDDLIMAPKPRVTSPPLEAKNQGSFIDNMVRSPKPHNYSVRPTLKPADQTATKAGATLALKESTFHERSQLLTTPVKAHKRRGLVTESPDNVNVTEAIDDLIYTTPNSRSSLSRLLSESAILTNIEEGLVLPKPDNLYSVLPLEFDNITHLTDDFIAVERILSESVNLTRVVNDSTPTARVMSPANLTEAINNIVRESETQGIFGGLPPVFHQPLPNIMVEDTEKALKTRGIFAKIPQDVAPEDSDMVSLIFEVPNAPDLGLGYSNQIAKLKRLPLTGVDKAPSTGDDIFNIPLSTQPFDKYKLLVVTAPPEIQMSGPNAIPWIIYVVFSEDNTTGNFNLPTVYFVNKLLNSHDKKLHPEPIIVIDPNRKVTGLKSNDIEKLIKFKSKLASTMDYNRS